jgi:hypothetical protein
MSSVPNKIHSQTRGKGGESIIRIALEWESSPPVTFVTFAARTLRALIFTSHSPRDVDAKLDAIRKLPFILGPAISALNTVLKCGQ